MVGADESMLEATESIELYEGDRPAKGKISKSESVLEVTKSIEPIEDVRLVEGKSSKSARSRLRAEEAANRCLGQRGYKVLENQYRCKAGVADIVARTGDCLCFIEVKVRRDASGGFPKEDLDARMRDRYERIAANYLKDHVQEELRVRFDVISIVELSEGRAFLRFHKNAYGFSW